MGGGEEGGAGMHPDRGASWRKSSRSSGQGGECVEVRSTLDAPRDSKNPSLILDAQLGEFIAAVKTGQLDR